MRPFLGLLVGIALIIPAMSGCGPSLSEDELGTVTYDAGQLPGADKPYELPPARAPAASPSAESGPMHQH